MRSNMVGFDDGQPTVTRNNHRHMGIMLGSLANPLETAPLDRVLELAGAMSGGESWADHLLVLGFAFGVC